jgi:hypothetical protein
MPAGSDGLAKDLEAVTLAMGVPLDRVYPIRGFSEPKRG